jgi:hypothetical protein
MESLGRGCRHRTRDCVIVVLVALRRGDAWLLRLWLRPTGTDKLRADG